ncbi:unnamed protein product [Psylliodes chrysocephalus]|uniref:Uncharacterized protein n=1 Tax=Psylliodes chrysocephalus TaxID=3402493 RepID=A0A9P0CDX5_9CUCU|nr:unnamed protein product [Psylliodes chrysocephala]
MSISSDGDYTEMEVEEDGMWKKVRRKTKDKLHNIPKRLNQLTKEIDDIIGTSSQTTNTKNPTYKNLSDTNRNPQPHKNSYTNKNNFNKNYSPVMNTIVNKKYDNMFYLEAESSCTRMNISTGWNQIFPNADDIIIKIVLKTNTNKDEIMGVLDRYVENGKILSYKESNPNTKPPTSSPLPSYSVIIARIEQEIDENSISRHLTNLNLEHRYCKRIIARSNAEPTIMIRIITGSQTTSEILLSHGLHYHYQHYPVYPSKAPEPVPQPCSKWQEYTHTTENCKNTQI